MNKLNHLKRFNESMENLDLKDTDYLFRLFYFSYSNGPNHSELIYKINDLLDGNENDVLVDWEKTSEERKKQIIDMIKSYIMTLD